MKKIIFASFIIAFLLIILFVYKFNRNYSKYDRVENKVLSFYNEHKKELVNIAKTCMNSQNCSSTIKGVEVIKYRNKEDIYGKKLKMFCLNLVMRVC